MSSSGERDPDPEVVILCGGRGTRLAPDTDVIPKPLVRVAGRPILWYIMDTFARHGLRRFVLCLGYRGEMIRDYFLNYHVYNNDFTLHLKGEQTRLVTHGDDVIDWEVTCVDTGMAAQTGARLRRVAKYIRAPYFLCTYGDGVSDVDVPTLISFHRRHQRAATVTGVRPPARFGELIVDSDGRVDRFSEKPQVSTSGASYINGGFFVFSREVFRYLSNDDDCVLEREPLERLASEDQLRMFRHEGFWQCMDTPKDRELLDNLLSKPSNVLARDQKWPPSVVGGRA